MHTDSRSVGESNEAENNQSDSTHNKCEENQAGVSGRIEKISATTDDYIRTSELMDKINRLAHEVESLKCAAGSNSLQSLRRTLPNSTSEMLAKHGIGDGPVDVRTLDAALAGLSLEQRIAVKTQLLRAGAIAS